MELQQPVINQVQYEYQSAPLFSDVKGYCYQFVANEDFVMVPDGNMHLLWDLNDKKMIYFSDEAPFIMHTFMFMKKNAHKYFGIALCYDYNIEINEIQLQDFSLELFRLQGFLSLQEFCNRRIGYIIFSKSNHPLLKSAMNKIIDTKGQVAIESVAACQGYTIRQVERIFLEHYGYSPKTMCRLIRMVFVLDLMKCHPEYSFAKVAEWLRFSDPPHLLREFKHFSGMTPKEFAIKYFHRVYE